MSRIPAVDPATAPGNVKASLNGLQSALNMTPNMFRVIANSAAALRGMIQLNAALGGGSLDHATREAMQFHRPRGLRFGPGGNLFCVAQDEVVGFDFVTGACLGALVRYPNLNGMALEFF